MADAFGMGGRWRVLATDLSTRKLAQARRGKYPVQEFGPLPKASRQRWVQESDASGTIHPELMARVTLARLNLTRIPFPMKGPFDVIFCRYVMMYFDTPVRDRLVRAFAELLPRGGLLFIGRGEVLEVSGDLFDLVGPSVLRRI